MDKCELQKIVDFLQNECEKGDMASVKINNEGEIIFSIRTLNSYPAMTVPEFTNFMEKKRGQA